MKTFLVLALAVLLALPMLAQDHAAKPAALPELQEWYSWSGARTARISYLPQFYKFGGMNAVTQKRDGRPTWFNRFPFDTTNQFTWQDSYFILPGDFNGDGITDYWGSGCYVYQGIAKDSMPDPVPAGQYTVVGAHAFVGDYNNDGYDDVFTPRDCIFPNGKCDIGTINFGDKNLSTMQQVAVVYPASSAEYWSTIAAYRNSAGKGRVLSFQKEDFVERFVLYGLEITATGDSMQVSLRELDKVEEFKTDKTQQVFLPTLSGLYLDNTIGESTLLLSALEKSEQQVLRIYSIEKDNFRMVRTQNTEIGTPYCFSGSVDGDTIPDVIALTAINSKGYIILYSGRPSTQFEPKAVLGGSICALDAYIAYIGDVTGDGIGDFAVGDRGCFVVYKGRNLSAMGIEEDNQADFSISQSEPNPIGKDEKTVIPLSLTRVGIYTLTLYDTGGRLIADLFSGELPAGSHRLPLDLAPYHLGSGLYVVRLSDGKATAERAIMIQR